MNSPRESAGAAAIRILSRMMHRPRSARPRRFRPLAESMEGRALLSHLGFTRAIVAPTAIAEIGHHRHHGPAARSGATAMDTVEVNGQVEVQPGD